MTFARLTKLLAILLVALAVWQMRAPARAVRVVVMALPGAESDVLGPVGGDLRSGEIRSGSISTGSAWWRRLFGRDEAADTGLAWDGEDRGVRLLAVPARLLPAAEQDEVVERGFLGSSSGSVVEAADVTGGRLPAPYDRVIDAVAAAAGNLPRDQWSDWMVIASGEAGGAAAAEFQFVHYDDGAYFFTPAYRSGDDRVVGAPFLRGLERPLRPLVSTHVIDLARRRFAPARGVFREDSDSSALVVFQNAVEAVTDVFAPDSVPALVMERAGDAIASDLAMLREAVGRDGLVLVVGGPPTTRQPVGKPWYRIVEGGGSVKAAQAPPVIPIEFEQARALVRYVTGLALDASEKALLPAELVARFPIVATAAASRGRPDELAPAESWSREAIESVPGAID